MGPVLACGLCYDLPMAAALPFLPWWLALFLVWALPFGLVERLVLRGRVDPPLRPLRWAGATVLALLASGLLFMGSLALAFGPILVFWCMCLLRLAVTWWRSRGEAGPDEARLVRAHLVFLLLLLLLVPLAWMTPNWARQELDRSAARHAAMRRTVPPASSTQVSPVIP